MRCIATLSDFCKTFRDRAISVSSMAIASWPHKDYIDETDRSHLLSIASNGPGLTITVPFMLVS